MTNYNQYKISFKTMRCTTQFDTMLHHYRVSCLNSVRRLIILAMFVCQPAIADKNWQTVIFENDFIANDDSGYSHGMGFSWGKEPQSNINKLNLPDWLRNTAGYLPFSQSDSQNYTVSYLVAQAIFTPADIKTDELIEDDRPYAGLLLWQTNLQSFNETLSERWRLTLGIVGPLSGAAVVQKVIHKTISANEPQGWEHQLQNELVFTLSGEQVWRLQYGHLRRNLEYDWLGYSGGGLGTLRSELGAGIGFRLGRSLRQSFPSASTIPGRNISLPAAGPKNEWHLFLNVYARYVFNDITIDGNTFKESHSVDLTHEQLFVAIGGEFNTQNWGFTASVQDSSRQFEQYDENGLFANFSLTYRW